jgi:hypothetical protein
MADFDDLSQWMATLKTSLPFVIASPFLIATAFASLADWVEDYLATYQRTASRGYADDASAAARQRQSAVTRSMLPALEGDGGRNCEHS